MGGNGLVWYKVSNFRPSLKVSQNLVLIDMDCMGSESRELPTYPSLKPKLLYKAVSVNVG